MQVLARSPFNEYLRALRTDATRKHYSFILKRLLVDLDAWLAKVKADKHEGEAFLLDFIAEHRTSDGGLPARVVYPGEPPYSSESSLLWEPQPVEDSEYLDE